MDSKYSSLAEGGLCCRTLGHLLTEIHIAHFNRLAKIVWMKANTCVFFTELFSLTERKLLFFFSKLIILCLAVGFVRTACLCLCNISTAYHLLLTFIIWSYRNAACTAAFYYALHMCFSPTPAITWSKVGGTLPEGRYRIENHATELTIGDIEPSDKGTYQCEGSNSAANGLYNVGILLNIEGTIKSAK
jgi:hypothetical protein